MAVYTYPLDIPRWAGELGQLVEAIELSVSTLHTPARINITLRGMNIHNAGVDDLETLSVEDRARLRELVVQVGEPHEGHAVYLRLDGGAMGNGLVLEVIGKDRTATRGLFGRLSEILEPKSPGWMTPWRVGVPAMAAVFVAWMLVLDQAGGGALTVLKTLIWMVVVIGSTLATGAACSWIFTPLELLAPGERPRSRRFRGSIVAFVVAVASSLVATYLYSGREA